jgi:phage baseplate assembly protein W
MSFDLKITDGDIRIVSGDLELTADSDKLIQDLLKIIITPLGANAVNPWYGSQVSLALIGNVFDLDFGIESAKAQVSTAVDNLQRMQLAQSQTQVLSPAESILKIKDVYVNTNKLDVRTVDVKVSVITAALTVVSAEFSINVL